MTEEKIYESLMNQTPQADKHATRILARQMARAYRDNKPWISIVFRNLGLAEA